MITPEQQLLGIILWFFYVFNPSPTGHGRNQPIYERHVTKFGRNRVKTGYIVLSTILGKRRAWQEIQNLFMRFVDPKSEVSAPMYCFEGSPLR